MMKLLQTSFCFVAMLAGISGQAQTPVSGVINTNTSFTLANSPYVVTGNLLVAQGVTLTIDPGVVLRFQDEKLLKIDGTLRAIGTPSDPILFMRDFNNQTGWAGVWFSPFSVPYDTLTGTGCVLSHAKIAGSTPYLVTPWQVSGIIWCQQADPLIEYTDISCSEGGIFFDNSRAVFRNNIVHDLTGAALYINPYNPPQPNDNVTIENNHFYNWTFPSFDGSAAFDFLGACSFKNNCLDGILANCVLRVRASGVRIINNDVTNSAEIGLAIQAGYDSTQVVNFNRFINSWIHILLPSCPIFTKMKGNYFGPYFYRAVEVNPFYYPFLNDPCPTVPYFSFNMQGNFWGNLTTASAIEGAIMDYNDDFLNVVDVDISNFLASPPNTPPVTACNEFGVNCSTLVVKDPLAELQQWEVFPVPSTDGILRVERLPKETRQLVLADLQGRVVRTWPVTGGLAQPLQVNDLETGIYLLTVETAAGSASRKVILQ